MLTNFVCSDYGPRSPSEHALWVRSLFGASATIPKKALSLHMVTGQLFVLQFTEVHLVGLAITGFG